MSNVDTIDGEPYEDSATYDLDKAAEALFGETWAEPLSRLTGVSLRTCQRIRAAARSAKDHEAADGVLHRLRERLGEVSVACDLNADELTWRLPQAGRHEARFLAGAWLKGAARDREGEVLADEANVLPFKALNLKHMIGFGERMEGALSRACNDLPRLLGSQVGKNKDVLLVLRSMAEALDAVVIRDAEGRVLVTGRGDAVFRGAISKYETLPTRIRFIMVPERPADAMKVIDNGVLVNILASWKPVELLAEGGYWEQAALIETGGSGRDLAEGLQARLQEAGAGPAQVVRLC